MKHKLKDLALTITQKLNYRILQRGFMNYGKITVITPPDKLFNLNLGYLLVKPSLHVKEQFHSILSRSLDDINVFIFDDDETDISWLLSVAQQADIIIIDVDNCDPVTKQFVTCLISQPNTHYITNDSLTPYHLISRNRIYNLDWIVSQMEEDHEEDSDEDYDDDEDYEE